MCLSSQALQCHFCLGHQLPLFRSMFILASPEQGRPLLQTLFGNKLLHANLCRGCFPKCLSCLMLNHQPLLAE